MQCNMTNMVVMAFDTTRLDEECGRVSREMRYDHSCRWDAGPVRIRHILLGIARDAYPPGQVEEVLRRCRRPKFVSA